MDIWSFFFRFIPLFLNKEEPPVRVACNVTTINYVLLEYADLVEVRKENFEEVSLYSLFRNVNPENNMFDFLKEFGKFYRL